MKVGEKIYYSSRSNDINSEIGKYRDPIGILIKFNYFTIVPAVSRGFMEVLKSGETLYDTWTATANIKYFKNKFEVGGLMWLEGEFPPNGAEISSTYGYKESATAVIKSVSVVNHTITLRLERNQHKQKK